MAYPCEPASEFPRHPLYARFYRWTSATAEARGQSDLRRRLLGGLRGRVIEIGAGSGLNFPFYPTSTTEVVAVEPEPYLRKVARSAAGKAPVTVSVIDGTAERLPVPDASFDAGIGQPRRWLPTNRIVVASRATAAQRHDVGSRRRDRVRYFEDIEIGREERAGPHHVSQTEIIDFARTWDPYPYHVDPVAALNTPFGGLAASGAHTIAIYYRLLYELSQKQRDPLVAIAALGFELRLPFPVRPGDQLTLATQPIEKRDSKSHPDAGVARTRGVLTNQDGRVVLELTAAYLFAKRPT